MLSVNYIKEEQNYYEQKIKELTEKDEYNIRRNQRQQKEIERLNNIIDELEKWLKEDKKYAMNNFECGRCFNMFDIINKLKELKEGKE